MACQKDESPGVLILSPFAGAGGLMHEALMVTMNCNFKSGGEDWSRGRIREGRTTLGLKYSKMLGPGLKKMWLLNTLECNSKIKKNGE